VDATLGNSFHFHTLNKPVPSPVKKSPLGPNSNDIMSFLANEQPLFENLYKQKEYD